MIDGIIPPVRALEGDRADRAIGDTSGIISKVTVRKESMLPSEITLHNRYRVIYTVDERPGSLLYRARDDQSGRLVLIAGLAYDSAELEDLRLLVQQVATVHHDYILPVLDHFEEGNRYYVVCQDITGQDLERTLRSRGGPLPEQPTLAQAKAL